MEISCPSTNPAHDHEWVINISRILEREDSDLETSSISIFNVPKSLLSSKPEAYTPQVIALGPYHHRRLELFEMESHKLTAARKLRKKLKSIKFTDLVSHIAQNDVHIRSCYHRYLDFDQQRLAWMLAVDVSCLLQFLRTYALIKQRALSFSMRNSLKMGYLMDHTRRKTWHQAILRDIVMLENQIPLFLLREVHGFCVRHEDVNGDELLASMLLGFCKDLAPIKHVDEKRFKEECFMKSHLLELLYYAVAPRLRLPSDGSELDQQMQEEENKNGCFRSALSPICKLISLLNCAPVHFLSKIFKSKIIIQLISIPWRIIVHIFKLRGNKSLSSAVGDIVSSAQDAVGEAEKTTPQEKDDSPLVEEIAIPSVEELWKTGVQFRPTKGGLNTIQFDKSSATFHLPVIHLNDNSDVILRNLVAYEACIAPERTILTRYTELMNGIIDTEEDVRILRENGILVNRMKSDKAVASMWNGMTMAVKVTRVPVMDKAIEGVNGYYAASWKVKVKETMKKYVYGSWPCLTFLAANVLIWLSVVQTVCSMYQCSKWLGNLTLAD